MFAIDFTDEQKENLNEIGVSARNYSLSRKGKSPFADIKSLVELTLKIKGIKPDIVFSYFAKPAIFGTLAATFCGTPKRIAMLEGLGFPFTAQPGRLPFSTKLLKIIQIILYRISLRNASDVIFLNKDDKRELIDEQKINTKDVYVFGPIGLNLVKYKGSEDIPNPPCFMFIGRLIREKGIFEFVEAAKIIKKRHAKTRFLVLGANEITSPNTFDQKELHLLEENNIVEFPGFVDDVRPWLNECTALILPSYREGFPRTSQEASAMGVPIITTDVPGCKETVIEGKTGYLVPPFNVTKIISKIEWFINNEGEIAQMKNLSRKFAEDHYCEDRFNQKLIQLFMN